MEDFIDLSYVPTGKDLNCYFYIEPPEGKKLSWSATNVAGESSVGTWTDVKTAEHALSGLAPHVYSINEKENKIKIAYPQELFEKGNIPCILSSVAGNIYGMKAVANLRLLDIQFPKEIVESFKGPRFGIDGVRKIMGVKDRPLVGTIVKPKLGLPYREHAKVAYDAWAGGCDIVKDDENLTSQKFNPFKERVKETLAKRDKAEAETGETKVYMPNVTAETKQMLERAHFVKDSGGRYIMVDIVTCGFSSLQTLADEDLGLVIHAHRAMHAALTRNHRHGLSMLVLAKLMRLIGMDQLHVGTFDVGKMEGCLGEISQIAEAITKDEVDETNMRLPQKWSGLKPIFPVASGGLHPGHIPELMERAGSDIIIQLGGGIHGHPEGTKMGATAARQAVDATLGGISLQEYAETHAELAGALGKWG
ncbi:MAG: type III ribulose-bisphosphate carboxylase [Candidatus Altiarchaeota archaeon]